MRAARAYIAGLGTATVLVGSALLLLTVVGTIVTFDDWGGAGLADEIENLVVGEPQRRPSVEGPARIALAAAPAAGAVAESPAGEPADAPPATTAPEPTRIAPRRPVPPPPRDPTFGDIPGPQQGSGLQPPSDPSSGQPVSAGDLVPQTPASAQMERVSIELGDTTQGVTDGLGQTVGGISPVLGETLVDSGRLLADLLRALSAPPR